MASLTGQKIKDTYQSLLKTDDNGLITNNFKGITDGSGSASGLYLRNNGVLLSGSIIISGSLLYSGSTIDTTVTSASYALTASYALNGESTNTGSLLVTASVSSNTITFTKGDASTFNITVDTGSATPINTSSLATTGSNTFNGNQIISGSIEISGSIIPATDGISTTSSFSLGSATNAWKDIWVSNGTINFIDGTGNVQATLSSTAEGLVVSGSLIATEIVAPSGSVSSFTGSLEGTASFALTASYSLNAGTTVDTGSLVTTSSFNSFTSSYNTGSFTGSFTGSLFGTASIAISASWAPFTPTDTGSLLVTASVSNNTITFTKGDASTFNITVNTGSVDLSGYTTNNTFNAFTSSYNTGSFTGSLQGVAATASYYVETDPIFTAVSGTLATTGSNTFNGNQIISGSLNVTGGITGSLLGTASYAFLAETASYALTAETASYAITITTSMLYVTSSSYSETASYVENAQSASYVLNAVSSSYAQTASYYAIPVAGFSWTSGYLNLTNGSDNNMRWDTTIFNLDSNIFELSGSGTADARIYIKQPGYYEFISQVHMYDLYNNLDMLVKLTSGSSTGALTTVSLFNDSKFSELTADQTLNSTIIVNVSTPAYYSVAVNPSSNTPYPSNTDNTPTRIFIKKLA